MSQDTISDVKFEDILRKVRGLVAKADSTTNEHEADAFRAKAEALMLKYRIEESLAFEQNQSAAGSGLEPTWMRMGIYTTGSEFAQRYRQIAGAVIHHIGGRAYTEYDGSEVYLEACGFPSDLRYGEVLMTSALLAFSRRLEPKVDPNASDAENAWNLRSAGWERKRIARELFGSWETENEMKAKNRKVTGLIKAYGALIGEDPSPLLGRGNMMTTFRDSYAEGFVSTLSHRLWRMRNRATEETGGGIIPVSRKEAIDAAFYERRPDLKPKEPTERQNAACAKCAAAKSGYCRDHQWMKPSQARYTGPRRNMRAYDRGVTAAHSVDLGGHGASNRIGDN